MSAEFGLSEVVLCSSVVVRTSLPWFFEPVLSEVAGEVLTTFTLNPCQQPANAAQGLVLKWDLSIGSGLARDSGGCTACSVVGARVAVGGLSAEVAYRLGTKVALA